MLQVLVLETHLEAEELEQYAMAIEPEPLGEEIEQHLLMCGDCCEMLRGLEEEIAALRIALRETEP
jgi:hypothetical protein